MSHEAAKIPGTPRRETIRYATDAQRWTALLRREAAADGTFYFGVLTTGVYCRPSCGARRPRRENVRFFATPADAQRAGLRACKRCRPDGVAPADRQAAIIARCCRQIERAEAMPTLAELARAAGMSRFHFHRLFKRVTGMTPKSYVAAHRAQRLRERLPDSASVTGAIYEAGFNSNARFYEGSTEAIGMTPSSFRRGGEGERIRFAIGACVLGALLVARTDKGICAILLDDDPDTLLKQLQDRFPKAQLIGADADFEQLIARVAALVETPTRGFDLPLDLRGTAFQHRVWQALRRIAPGTTVSYAELARRVGRPDAVRAVAGAVAANRVAVAIPCHRVIRQDGSLSGYRWGVARKRALLELEGTAR